MRTIAAALLALALPATAQAQFAPQAPRDTGYYRTPPINGRTTTGDARVDRKLDRLRNDSARPPDTGYRTPEIDGRARPGPVTFGRELDRARHDIDRRRDRGELSHSEAKELRREAARIGQLAARFRRDGLTEFERSELDLRTTELRNRTATGRTS